MMETLNYRLFASIMLLLCIAFAGGFIVGRNAIPTTSQKVTTKYLNNRDIIIVETDSSVTVIDPETMQQTKVKIKGAQP